MHRKLVYSREDGDYMAAIMFRLEISFASLECGVGSCTFGREKGKFPRGFLVNCIYILYKSMDNVLFRLDRSVRMGRNS